MNDNHKDFLAILGYIYLQHGLFQKSLIIFKTMQLFFPNDAHAIKSLSYAYLMLNEYQNALTEIDKLNEHDKPALLIKSKALWGLGNVDESRIVLQTYLDMRKS
ncbi:MAG: hypothetical protein HQK77_22335 [Desulfobacterales bacterium]|nr:hypothetical protein [Desulfobacterales bacterium]